MVLLVVHAYLCPSQHQLYRLRLGVDLENAVLHLIVCKHSSDKQQHDNTQKIIYSREHAHGCVMSANTAVVCLGDPATLQRDTKVPAGCAPSTYDPYSSRGVSKRLIVYRNVADSLQKRREEER